LLFLKVLTSLGTPLRPTRSWLRFKPRAAARLRRGARAPVNLECREPRDGTCNSGRVRTIFRLRRLALVQAPHAGSRRGSFSLKREQELRAPRPARNPTGAEPFKPSG